MIILVAFFLFLLFRSFLATTCFGFASTSSSVCNGNGVCIGQDHCICNDGYSGVKCDIKNFDKKLFLENYNIRSNRLLCGGMGNNNLCNNLAGPSNLVEKSNLGHLVDKTIKDVCMNKYWGIAIDSDYKVYIWGSLTGNDYLSTSSDPKEITNWPTKAKRVACTQSSLFVLNYDKTLYAMGKNEDNELGGVYTSFFLIKSNIRNIETSKENVYVVEDQLDSSQKQIVYVGGKQYSGSSNFAFPWPVVSSTNFEVKQAPRIIPISQGVLYSFAINKHVFAGRDHPSTKQLETNPVPINFSYTSQLKNTDPIDLIGRQDNNGCLVIVSDNKIFISGVNCGSSSLVTPSIDPYQIKQSQRNELPLSEEIVDFQCAESICYFLTSESVYAFGQGMPTEMLHFPSTAPILTITKVRDDLLFLIPAMGTLNFLSFRKIDPLNLIEKTVVNKFPPKFDDNNANVLMNGKFNLKLVKNEVFGQMDPVIRIGTTNESCWYPPVNTPFVPQIWKFENTQEFGKGGLDYYSAVMNWEDHKKYCGWESSYKDGTWGFTNRIYFHEFFWLEYDQSFIRERREDFSMDVLLKYKDKVTLDIDFTVKKDNISVVLVPTIVSKQFDRPTSKGELFIQLRFPAPLLAQNVTIGTISIPGNFKNTPTIQEVVAKRYCSGLYCYQVFMLTYIVANGICIPSSDFQIKGDISCTNFADPNCEVIPGGLDTTLKLLQENICSQLVENVELEGWIKSYKDWQFKLETKEFEVTKYAYFLEEVNAVNNKATILTSVIEDVKFNNHILYQNQSITSKGTAAGLIIYNVQPPGNRTAFSFRILQEHTLLAYGASGSFEVCVTIRVTYQGNNRRRTILETHTYPIITEPNPNTQIILPIKVKHSEAKTDYSTIVVYSSIGIAVASIIIFLLFIASIAFFFSCCSCRNKRKISSFEIKV